MFISFSFIAFKRERDRTKEREKRKDTIPPDGGIRLLTQ